MKISEIYEGWRNNLFPPEKLKKLIQEISKKRTEMCSTCENNSIFHSTIRPDRHCIICGCTLSAKTKCLSCSCPIYKWREVVTSDEEEEMKNGRDDD